MSAKNNDKYTGPRHNDLFAVAQDTYLTARAAGNKREADRYLGEMYKITRECCQNMIRKTLKKNGVTESNIEDDIEDATMYVISKYLLKPEFRVKRLSAYAHFAIVSTLYSEKRKTREKHEVSLEAMEEGTDNLDFQD
jgi:hypothetical protein